MRNRTGPSSLVSGVISLVFVASVYAGLAVPIAAGQETKAHPEFARARAALEKYKDPIVAIHDGYFSTLGCVEFSQAGGEGQLPYKPGGMGIHFLNLNFVGPVPDPARPQVLIYEPDGDKLRLVAAEWFVPLATGVKERPQLWGQPFDGPMEGHHPLMPATLSHYDLHVWLFKDNPLGPFSPTNPDVRCGSYPYSLDEAVPRFVARSEP